MLVVIRLANFTSVRGMMMMFVRDGLYELATFDGQYQSLKLVQEANNYVASPNL